MFAEEEFRRTDGAASEALQIPAFSVPTSFILLAWCVGVWLNRGYWLHDASRF